MQHQSQRLSMLSALPAEFVVHCTASLSLSEDNIDTKDKMEITASS
jgi:hypothetical protein